MKQIDLNALPEKLRNGTLSEKEVVNEFCCFVAKNYPLYGLHKYDEDFRQDIILSLIERGPYLLQLYNPQLGDFFTFLYCYISTLINSRFKKNITSSMKERLAIEESISGFEEKEIKYHRIDFTNFEVPKIPFAHKSVPPEELQKALKSLSLKHQDKKVIILALKSSYYLTDEQIHRICSLCNINPDDFYNMIQHCKDSLENKLCRWEKAQERRNFAYHHHKRCNRIIYDLNDDDNPDYKLIMKKKYESKDQKHLNNLNKINNSFEKGNISLRTRNKTIAFLMGICERQVNYYINCAKKEMYKKMEEKAAEG